MPIKQSSPKLSTIAAKVLAGKTATRKEQVMLAASVMGQDETKGQAKKKPAPKKKSN